MADSTDTYILKNGMVILGEPMEGVGSAAFTFRIPAGASVLPEGCCGAAAVINDWLFRGAGNRDSRSLVDALDGLGLHRNSGAGSSHISLGAALEASNLLEAIKLYADIILKPRLEPKQFELSKQLAINDVLGLDDDPRHKVNLNLYEQFYPKPFGRPGIGKLDELEGLTVNKTLEIIKQRFIMPKSILAIAGKYDFDAVCKLAEKLFGEHTGEPAEPPLPQESYTKYSHEQHEGAQVHIGLMTKVPPITNEDTYYDIMAAVSILSGSMSGRLFTEVREKRGLCYFVGARYHSLKDYAGISCYAGTTPDKGQETLDVTIGEFDRLGKDITDEEMHRAKIGLKSSLIMQSESSSARAEGIASDHYLLGRVRSLDEIKQRVEQTSIESVSRFLENNKFVNYTVTTIGPKEVKV